MITAARETANCLQLRNNIWVSLAGQLWKEQARNGQDVYVIREGAMPSKGQASNRPL